MHNLHLIIQEKPEKDLHLHSDQALEIQFFKWIYSGVQKYQQYFHFSFNFESLLEEVLRI